MRYLKTFISLILNLFKILLYIPIQIVFIPFAIIGIIIGIYKAFVVEKKLGVSYSAGQALQYRWFMHYFDTREDRLSVEFIKNFPCESHFGLWSLMGPLIISQKLFGFTTKLGKIDPPGEESLISTGGRRVLVFDEIVKKYVDTVDQIVISGVGFDLVALHFTKDKNVKVFEIDQVNTINVKTETLKKAGIDHDWINYLAVDFLNESWVDKLIESGFDKSKKTLFIWESVSLFLEVDIVKKTLSDMAELCSDGSIIAQDFYSDKFIAGKTASSAKKQMNMMKKMGEPWKFGVDMSDDPKKEIEQLLNECGLKITEINIFGEKLNIEPYYCIVETTKRLVQ